MQFTKNRNGATLTNFERLHKNLGTDPIRIKIVLTQRQKTEK